MQIYFIKIYNYKARKRKKIKRYRKKNLQKVMPIKTEEKNSE